MHYTFQQWLMFFYVYCFIGWCFESTYVSILKRRFVNRGFLHSPLLPIYGSGAVVMLVATLGLRDHIVWMFLAGMVGATALELVVGLSMEAIFKVKYWDYSNQKLNYKGVICLSSSLCWGLFTVLLNKYLHKPVEAFVMGLPPVLVTVVVIVISVIFITDAAVSIKVALGIRDMLDVSTRLRKELNEVQVQLNERVNAMRAGMEEKKDSVGERLGTLLDSIGDKLTEMAGAAGSKMDSLIDATYEKLGALAKLSDEKDEEADVVSSLGEKLKSLKQEHESQTEKMAYLKMKMLKRNPSATSRKFAKEFSVLRTEQIKRYEIRRKEKKENRKQRHK